jgi:hypothetical protein
VDASIISALAALTGAAVRRDEQNRIGGLDAPTERGPWRGRSCGIKILIVERQLPDLDDVRFQ